jgi:2-methylcitrate dehydratase PrpD
MTMQTTAALARFASSFERSRIPAEVRHAAAQCLLNWAGCALGGAAHPAVERAMEALMAFSGKPSSSLIGRGERCDALHAALFNGISSHVLDFDDTHLATLVHPSGPVISAALALAQHQPVDGASFVDAIALGIEVECRVALGVYPAHYDIGWHITGTAGVFGAAAAAGRMLGLDEERMAWALGIAATQAAGLREMFGTMCKSLHPGRAAQGGLNAALMAGAGFTSSLRGIEAPRGFANVTCSNPHLDDVTAGLGETWEILKNSYKPYACGVVIHPVIDACLELRKSAGFAPEDVAAVELSVHPLVLELTGKTEPTTGLEGKFSVFHGAAIALQRGESSFRDFTDEAVRDAHVIALRRLVTATIVPGTREDEARVTITLRNGQRLASHVPHALGSLERPMSDADIERKFRDLAQDVLPQSQIDKAIDLCWKIDEQADAGTVGTALSQHPASI